jgi:hypothetical protein
MTMLHLICERCGFQAFAETRFQAAGWQFKTSVQPSLCLACIADLKLIESLSSHERERRAAGKPDRAGLLPKRKGSAT